MSKMNWNKVKPRYASYGSKRQLALKLKRRENTNATPKQLSFMDSLSIDYLKNISKKDASFLISKTLKKIEKAKNENFKMDLEVKEICRF